MFIILKISQVDGSISRPQSMEGPMDSGISLNGDTISSPDSDNSSQHHIQNQSVSIFAISNLKQWFLSTNSSILVWNKKLKFFLIKITNIIDFNTQQDIETRKSKRGHVLGELLETERIYVAEMGSILRVSRNQYNKPKLFIQTEDYNAKNSHKNSYACVNFPSINPIQLNFILIFSTEIHTI